MKDSLFQRVIIDEAAQSTEQLSLIPLPREAKHCILVGDEKQLRPTVHTSGVAKRVYAKS